MWHHTRTSCRIPVAVLVDTGVGGGNYSSAAFVRSVERSGRGGQSVMSPRGQGWSRAAKPRTSVVHPVRILWWCELPLVLSRVVEDIPYGLIIRAAFLRKHGSIISFAAGGGFKPTPGSPWVPFISSTGASNSKPAEKKAVSWQASVQTSEADVEAMAMVNRATWAQFCAVKLPHGEGDPEEMAEPPTQPSEGSVALEDDRAVQWELRPAQQTVMPGSSACRCTLMAKERNSRTGS